MHLGLIHEVNDVSRSAGFALPAQGILGVPGCHRARSPWVSGGCHSIRNHRQTPRCPRGGVCVSSLEKLFLENPRWIPLSFCWPGLSHSSLPNTKHWHEDWISMTGLDESGFNPESYEARVDTQTKCRLSRKEEGYTGL